MLNLRYSRSMPGKCIWIIVDNRGMPTGRHQRAKVVKQWYSPPEPPFESDVILLCENGQTVSNGQWNSKGEGRVGTIRFLPIGSDVDEPIKLYGETEIIGEDVHFIHPHKGTVCKGICKTLVIDMHTSHIAILTGKRGEIFVDEKCVFTSYDDAKRYKDQVDLERYREMLHKAEERVANLKKEIAILESNVGY